MQNYMCIVTYDIGRDNGHFNLHFMALKQVSALLLQPHKLICTIIHTKFHENLSTGLKFKGEKISCFSSWGGKQTKKFILNLLRVV